MALVEKRIQKRSVIGSMSLGMRLIVVALSALTLAFTLVFASLLYRVGTAPNPAGIPAPVLIEQTASDDVIVGDGETDVDSTEDEAAAAVPSVPQQPRRNVPIHLILGFAIGFAVVFFITHIMRVNANIEDMNRKTR